ncbi:type 1 fimbrial protein [Lysobacter arenosi]|uniref:Type 1 fimbrial protein n=1 Tax=Lysobacter arenosi TaxID=2795387 RepID=A0ABX7RAT4_9GAMM|nr:fimbrial protein [Lysobacter arenosi]QSX74406.1 type 1 fimbrial protein [Lysobacter arenosi]
MKTKILGTFALGAIGLASHSASASDGTINFSGSITSQTCSINGVAADGNRNISVALPKTPQSSLTALNSVAGETPFSIALTGCTPASGTVATRFEPGSNVDAATGELITSGVGGTSSLHIQLLNETRGVINIGAPDVSQNSTAKTIPAGGAVTLNYFARYKRASTLPALGTGVIASNVTYSLVYN